MEVYTKKSSCAVTHEVVEALAKTNPSLLMHNGSPSIARCLYLLGFDIREDLPRNNYSVRRNVLIRSGFNNKKVRSTIIYSGYIRYSDKYKRFHHMYDTYNKTAVLDVPVIKNLIDIQKVGGKDNDN